MAVSGSALQVQRLEKTSFIPSGSPIIFDSIVFESGSISYDSNSGEITINNQGVYYVDWWVGVNSGISTSGVGFAVSVVGGETIVGGSPIMSGEVTGNALININTVPTVIKLINLTLPTMSVKLAGNAPVKADLTIFQVNVGIINGS